MKFRGDSRFTDVVRAALREDRAWNDLTSRTFVPPGRRAVARIVAEAPGVAAGVRAACEAFRLTDRRCRATPRVREGAPLRRGRTVLVARGPLASLLAAERTALNLLCHLSGVATLTRAFVRRAGARGPRVLDTRKTLPGLRKLQKFAVLCGGGTNHRSDLAAAVLVKENHLAAVRTPADERRFAARVAALRRRGIVVEVECQTRRDVARGLAAGADVLLLDNFTPAALRALVRDIAKSCRARGRRRPLLEASGGVTLETMRVVSRTGVDRVSVGRLTHSAPALDMSLEVE